MTLLAMQGKDLDPNVQPKVDKTHLKGDHFNLIEVGVIEEKAR